MANQFQFNIPITNGDTLNLEVDVGDVIYLLGANGTGKSSLVTRLFGANQQNAKRILDLPRFSTGSVTRLSNLSFKSQWAFTS
jgi:ABC-type cobalamin/Fe3+-siderophores transport system ATPase subunit